MKYEWVEWWAYKGWDYLVKYIEMVICGYGTEYEINFGQVLTKLKQVHASKSS